jgi:hypothetical protein
MRWRGDRLDLGAGHALVVSATRGARVDWNTGALELAGTLPARGTHDGLELRLVHDLAPLVHLWLPHLAPLPGDVIGDRVFRSPAVVLATRALALALVVDVDDVAAAQGWRALLDYDQSRRRLTLAAGAYRVEGHVRFVREPLACAAEHVRLRLHVVASRRRADRDNPYGLGARFVWERWGRPRLPKRALGHARISRALSHIVRWAFDGPWSETVWQSFALDGEPMGAPVFIVDVAQHPSVPAAERRWREPLSIWNQAWFSTQRCANGLYRLARQRRSRALRERAQAMTAIALAAPERDGLFPSVLTTGPRPPYARAGDTPSWALARWAHSDRRPPSASPEACHIADAATTARALLEWHALTGDGRALARARAFAARLVRLQRRSGAFPGWVEPNGRVTPDLAESAESAVGASLLFEMLSAGHGEPAWRAVALRAVAFLETRVARADWQDFETWWSCCPPLPGERPGRVVARNGVGRQSTLAMFWTAEALLAAFVATRRRRFLRLARRVVDELSLYQAVWDPPFLPAPAHGGFGVMNADSEWNDARQSLFAPLYLELYRATGDAELRERGIAALGAAFSLLYCPENARVARAYERQFPSFGHESYGFMAENQGHGAGAPLGSFTIFTWGPGSALAALATVRDRFGDILAEGW